MLLLLLLLQHFFVSGENQEEEFEFFFRSGFERFVHIFVSQLNPSRRVEHTNANEVGVNGIQVFQVKQKINLLLINCPHLFDLFFASKL